MCADVPNWVRAMARVSADSRRRVRAPLRAVGVGRRGAGRGCRHRLERRPHATARCRGFARCRPLHGLPSEHRLRSAVAALRSSDRPLPQPRRIPFARCHQTPPGRTLRLEQRPADHCGSAPLPVPRRSRLGCRAQAHERRQRPSESPTGRTLEPPGAGPCAAAARGQQRTPCWGRNAPRAPEEPKLSTL